jgi:hypothetical protein
MEAPAEYAMPSNKEYHFQNILSVPDPNQTELTGFYHKRK